MQILIRKIGDIGASRNTVKGSSRTLQKLMMKVMVL